jgi:hypothetical protein
VTACAQETGDAAGDSLEVPEANWIIRPDAAGDIRIGMSVDEVRGLVGAERVTLFDLAREGQVDPAVRISVPGATVTTAIVAPVREHPCPAGYQLQGLRILDPRYRTPEGIGVGSTLGEARRHYDVRLSQEEGPHAWVESIRANFALPDGSGADSLRILSVWLPGNVDAPGARRCPESNR